MSRLFALALWALLAWTGTVGVGVASDFTPPEHHADIEHIARNISYLGGNAQGGVGMRADPELRDAAAKRGLVIRDVIDDTTGGLQAMVLQRKSDGHTVIAFRGTWPTSADGINDVVADLDLSGDTGSSQYNAHKAKLAKWANKYRGATVTGHSLGAALAQRFVSDHPSAVTEAVLFNAPAIGKEHGHRLARAKEQPPVTIYLGRSTPTDGTRAPAFDIVSEYGGQSHIPGRIVEVTHLDPTDGSGATLMTSHTGFMLSGRGQRKIEDVPYEQYQQRREDSWREAGPMLRQARSAIQTLDAAQGAVRSLPGGDAVVNWAASQAQFGGLAQATANIAHGFGRAGAGPTAPTEAMRNSSERDCSAAMAKANAALTRAQGRVTGTRLSAVQLFVRQARQKAVGCPIALGLIESADKIVAVVRDELLHTARGNIKTCDAKTVTGQANSIASFLDQPNFAAVHRQLKERAEALRRAKAKVDASLRGYEASLKSGDLDRMDAHALAIMEAAGSRDVKECMADSFMHGRNLRTSIVGHRVASRTANAAIDSCDLTALSAVIRDLKGQGDAMSKGLRARARSAYKKCKKNETPQQRLERWTKRCVTKKGPGATVGFISKDGKKFWCRPTKVAADASCVRKKGEPGWVAGRISKKGRYKCQREKQTPPKINLAGRWHITSWAHPRAKWTKSKRGREWLDVTVNASGTAGTLNSVYNGGKKNIRGKWSHIGNGVMEVLWADGERLRYKVTKLTPNSASIVKISNGFRVNYQR